MANKDLETLFKLITDNEKDKERGVHFPLTDIYNEGWLLRLALSKGVIQKKIQCETDETWFSEAELPSPFLHGEKRENRTHADAVMGFYQEEENTKTGIKLNSNFDSRINHFYAIEAKINARLSNNTTNSESENKSEEYVYDQATRYVACLAYLAAQKKISSHFENLGLIILNNDSKIKIKKINEIYTEENLRKHIKKALSNRIEEYDKANEKNAEKPWFKTWIEFMKWWEKNKKEFLSSVTIKIFDWSDYIDCDDETKSFYNKCIEYNKNR